MAWPKLWGKRKKKTLQKWLRQHWSSGSLSMNELMEMAKWKTKKSNSIAIPFPHLTALSQFKEEWRKHKFYMSSNLMIFFLFSIISVPYSTYIFGLWISWNLWFPEVFNLILNDEGQEPALWWWVHKLFYLIIFPALLSLLSKHLYFRLLHLCLC